MIEWWMPLIYLFGISAMLLIFGKSLLILAKEIKEYIEMKND